ncbi:MAG TPA: MBL fold metallo-hydrolase [Burkholderiales bacterium]|jgi:glyoxylase-like metal-dependent hydrolase (beta-lactamase superfamily II)
MNDPAAFRPVAAGLSPLQFPFAGPPEAGTTLEIEPGIFWLRMPLPFALDHINLWVLRDGDGWTLIDCGLNSARTRELWEAIFGSLLATGSVNRVLVTHFHPDHVGLAGWLTQRFGVELWMTEAEFLTTHVNYAQLPGHTKDDTLALFQRHGLDSARAEVMRAHPHVYRRAISEPPAAFRRIMDCERIDIGEHAWSVVTGYGHAPEHAALYCRELGLLISGDMVLPKISTNVSVWAEQPEADPLDLFLKSVDRYAQLPPGTLVLPSHGLPFRGLQARAAALHEHHAARLDEVLAACAQPASAAQIVPVLFRRALDDHQMSFAMGEAIAHLNHLLHKGRVARSEHDGMLRFAAL